MRKLLLLTTALVAVASVPDQARAEPVSTAIIAWAGVGAGTFAATAISAAVNLTASYVLSSIAVKLSKGGQSDQQVTRSELSRPTALPAYRFVYGYCWAPGTPVGWVVRGRVLYICYLLNSRPSDLSTHKVLLDKRGIEFAGDPFDFAGGGAVATDAPFAGNVRYWIGRGDQGSCPSQIVAESDYFAATDAWRGRTVLWARFDCGDEDGRSERWPATPPELNVEGSWSLLYDPRSGQTGYSRNQALCVLDALRNNPVRPYSDGFLWLDTFGWAADVADQAVFVAGGGSIPRYACDGVLIWGSGTELEDQLNPLLAAGGARFVRAGGQLGIVPAAPRPSVHTIRDYTTGQPLSLTRWQAGDDVYTECVGTYTAPDRAYEPAETPAYIVPGAQDADGGLPKRLDLPLDFVVDYRQAERLVKIAAEKSRLQRRVSCELFPDAFVLVAGARAALDLPAPLNRWNGGYEVDSITPAAGINDDRSITLRLPVTLSEYSDTVYDWSWQTDEVAVPAGEYPTSQGRVAAPVSVTLSTGGAAALINSGTVTARVQIDFGASVSASALSYEWQWQVGAGPWQDGGTIDATATLRAWIAPVAIGSAYTVRVRTVGIYGKSNWRNSDPIIAAGPTETLDVPTLDNAIGGSGVVTVNGRQGNDGGQLEIWSGTVDDHATATRIATLNAGANVAISYVAEGQPPGATLYFWLRARDAFGNASAFTPSRSATTA